MDKESNEGGGSRWRGNMTGESLTVEGILLGEGDYHSTGNFLLGVLLDLQRGEFELCSWED
jgi:hypothetical protein